MPILDLLTMKPVTRILPKVGDRLSAFWGHGAGYSEGVCVGFLTDNPSIALIVDQDLNFCRTDGMRTPNDLSPIGWRETGTRVASSEVFELIRKANAKKAADDKKKQEQQIQNNLWIEQGKKIAQKHFTPDVVALIIAEYRVDESDSQTDYFNSRSTRTVVLATSKHKRHLFPEMRKAAAKFKETEHLVTGGVEHRENYSMGRGNYLSEHEYSNATGWTIRKNSYSMRDDSIMKALGQLNLLDA